MALRSAAATEVARQLWARVAGDTSAPEEVAAAAARMCTQLRGELEPWIGADGYRTALDRALVLARAEHPALGDLSCLGGDEPVTTAAVRAHGSGKAAAGLVALVAAFIELLGLVIGEEMAVSLAAPIGIPSPGGLVSSETEGRRNG